MSDIQASVTRLLDEASIRNATARFADAAIRADYDSFRTVWADDGEWTIGTPPKAQAQGMDDIVAMLRRLREGKEFFVQFAVQGAIEISGDQATTSCVCTEAARGPGEVYYRNHCMALDRLKRSENGWVFTSRSFQYLWLDTSPFGGDSFSLPSPGSAS
ncbi:nuclear transport factor 2 family protein [Massilia sp. CMS3.1]|uniref:nuclear transport factor 2 family protein n=1 Tax=Massilia sp. CMS3.1 TaxID=3373083 RepID=UPI003EE818D3